MFGFIVAPSCPASVVTLAVDGIDIIECASASGLSSRMHHPRGADVEERLDRRGEVARADVIDRDAVAHLDVLRMLDVEIEHLREEQQRLVRRQRKSEACGHLRGEHSLRQRHQARRRGAAESEERLMLGLIEIDVHVAHQLGKLRRRAVRVDHLRADAGDPQQLRGRARIAEVDALHARRPFHRVINLVDRVNRRDELLRLFGGSGEDAMRRRGSRSWRAAGVS